MAKLLITTQVYENYAWREDGTLGTGAEAYWKAKGGNDYVVRSIDINRVQEIVEQAAPQIESNNDAFQEMIIGWEVVADDYLTEFERDQLEYDGRIMYPAQEITVQLDYDDLYDDPVYLEEAFGIKPVDTANV